MRMTLLVAATACLALTACGGTDDDASTTRSAGATTAARGAAFPVTIKHRYGSATIPRQPQRVVAVSNVAGDLDPLVAVGVVPVATSRDLIDPSGIFPWLRGKISTGRTKLLNTANGVPLEQVAALHPDLILATGYAEIAANVKKLEQIAPTVTYRRSWYRQTWQEQTRLVGRAVGRTAQANRAVADTEQHLADVLRTHPKLRGKTFTMSSAFEPGKIVTIRDPEEVVSKLFGQIGLQLAPGARRVPRFSADNDGGAVSLENLDALDADVMIVSYASPQIQQATEANPLFKRIPAVRDGRYLAIDMETITALRVPSVLGIPWALQRIEPVLAKAAR